MSIPSPTASHPQARRSRFLRPIRLNGRKRFADLVEGGVLAVGQPLQVGRSALVLLARIREQIALPRRERHSLEHALQLGCALTVHRRGISLLARG